MKRFFAVALSAMAVIAVIIALQFVPGGRAAPVVRASGSHHPIKLRNWSPPRHRRYPMWVVPAHGGAVATTSATSAAPCAAGLLKTAYWTSFPAMTTVLSGFNVTNSGSRACRLPRFPGAISLAAANGAAVKLARFTRQGDFTDFKASTASVARPAKLAGPALGLTLRPGGTAAVLLYTFSSLDSNPRMACISAQRGGFLDVRLPGAQKLAVKVPSDAQPATAANPTSSAFTSCGVVTVSAFLTWKDAKSLVGVPVPESAATGAIPLVPRFKAIFAAAP